MNQAHYESRRASSWRIQRREIDFIARAGLAIIEASVRRTSVDEVIRDRYADDERFEATRVIAGRLEKAAQNPAMTIVPEWAGALVRESVVQMLEAVAVESVVARLPLQRASFSGDSSVTVVGRSTTAPTSPNLAAAFRAEGAPIRAGSVALAGKRLTPKSMGIIATFTEEMFRRSTSNLEDLLRNWMVEDTSVILDGIFFGDAAGTGGSPAGIASGVAAGDTVVSSGNSAAQIDGDIRGRMAALLGHGLGRRPVWIMHTARALGVAGVKTAAGVPLYPTMSQLPPLLYGIPVEHGLNIPSDVVFLVDAAELALGIGEPLFAATKEGLIHEEYVTPLPIVSGPQATAVVASPARSLFQTVCAALRATWEADWAVLRAGAVQTITSVTW